MKMKLIAAFLSIFAFQSISVAEEAISYYRDATGQVPPHSAANLEAMIDTAKVQGTIRVWVDFGLAFQPDPALRTPEIIAQEAAARDAAIAEIIAPLIHQGKATRIIIDPVPAAPGCMLEIDHQGIHALGKNERVKYIGYLPVIE